MTIEERKPSEKALQIAAQCWCDDNTSDRVMDIELAIAFVKRLDNDYAAIAELTERNIKLGKALRVAVEALEKLSGPVNRNDSAIVADKALTKIEEVLK
jgi:hypothetical protein